MQTKPLGASGLRCAPLVLGGNVFGWTLDEPGSFAVLDAFVAAGFNAIDTADVYSAWAPGNSGGESETLIGRWLRARPGMRQQVLLFTKVGSEMGPQRGGLSARWIEQAAEDSLRRLGVDHIDLYFSHWPDDKVPHEETLRAYERLLGQGKIRAIGASNFNATQLSAALRVSQEQGLPAYQVLQPEYNLYDRAGFEGKLRDLCIEHQLGVVTYFSLASGFLTGKYRNADDLRHSARQQMVEKYLDERGMLIVAALDEVAEQLDVQPAEVALAWLMQREGVTAPIASATSPAQVDSFVRAASLRLADDQLRELNAASAIEAVPD